MHDQLLAAQPEGARHDTSICPFCRSGDQADAHASGPSGDEPSGAVQNTDTPTQEGGTQHAMSDTMTTETHEALLAKALNDATDSLNKALEHKTDEAKQLAAAKADLDQQVATLSQDNKRLNGELDKAQLDLKTSRDETAALKADLAAKDEAARISDLASKRTAQVRNLGLFDDTYVTERAERWATLSDDDWADRIDEWSKAKPAAASSSDSKSDAASAMTGTSGELTTDPAVDAASEQPARRRVLGLA